MSNHTITVTVNGQRQIREVPARLLLVHFIRENLELTGTHIGCDTTSCGACTVLLNGRTVKSCSVFAVQANGGEVETIDGRRRGRKQTALEGQRRQVGIVLGSLGQALANLRCCAFQAPGVIGREGSCHQASHMQDP